VFLFLEGAASREFIISEGRENMWLEGVDWPEE
jgi:hypothetical protein